MKRLECFDCVNAKRFRILKVLEGRSLDLGEISSLTGFKKNTIFYHLKILLSANLVEKKEAKKRTWWIKAKFSSKDVVRWSLTHDAILALDYFGRDSK